MPCKRSFAESLIRPPGLLGFAWLGALACACAPEPVRAPPSGAAVVSSAEQPHEPSEGAAPEPAPSLAIIDAGAPERAPDPRLRHPDAHDEIAPERFTVLLTTSAGELHLDVRRGWAPHSADHIYTLVKLGYFDGLPFPHVLPGRLAQFGAHDDPALERLWRARAVAADAVLQTNNRGMVSLAQTAVGRSNQLVINLADNSDLDRQGLAPLGRVRELEVASRLSNQDRVRRATIIDEKPVRGSNTP